MIDRCVEELLYAYTLARFRITESDELGSGD